ncbi:hypothetical protein [Pseudomonas brassicacearum]|uniref:hypothetical protein n=1 Tax=Pseudomonas brassicacearum TaxID=930166 RepID=UPI00161CA531|nr:hypothetical protein [Pseudomonas brassicacearum]
MNRLELGKKRLKNYREQARFHKRLCELEIQRAKKSAAFPASAFYQSVEFYPCITSHNASSSASLNSPAG